jgi:hypothetical protein
MTVQQLSGIDRTDLQQHDLSAPGREVLQNRVEITPEAPSIKHKHRGEDAAELATYVAEKDKPLLVLAE